MSLTPTTLGKLQVPLPASAPRERHKDVYGTDATLSAAGASDDGERSDRCCLTVDDKSLLGLLPADQSSAPLWLTIPLSEFAVTAEGQKGAFKKLPASIILDADGFPLTLSDVDQLFLAISGPTANSQPAHG